MNAATHKALDEWLTRVHKRWCELTAEYVRTFGDISPAVYVALFDRAVAEIGK